MIWRNCWRNDVDYPLWLTEVRSFPHLEYFRTDLGIVFGFLANDSDPGKLRAFLSIHKKEFQSLREDAYDMITVMSQDWKLAELKQDYQNEKGEVDMCKAIDGLLKEEFQTGFQSGEENGIRLTKKVFLLWNSGTPKAEIAKECDISPEKVNRILEWDE